MSDFHQRALDELRINPNPRIVALLDYAIDEIMRRVSRLQNSAMRDEYGEWLDWAAAWRQGERSPQRCVDMAHQCFSHKGSGFDGKAAHPIWHSLGQIAWGAKEACYSAPTSGWLVIRYIADAMIAFGIKFPTKGLAALDPPTIDATAEPEILQLT